MCAPQANYKFSAFTTAKRISRSEQTHLSRAADLYAASKQEDQKSGGEDKRDRK